LRITSAPSNNKENAMRYLIIPLAAALLASACDSSEHSSAQARADRAEDIAKVERFLESGPLVLSEAQVDAGTLMTVLVPQFGFPRTTARAATCLVFIHASGASSMSCPGEPEIILASNLK
jgi:hypothetical protein